MCVYQRYENTRNLSKHLIIQFSIKNKDQCSKKFLTLFLPITVFGH